MGGGGDSPTEVAEVMLDLPEGLALGKVGQLFGHLPQPGLGLPAQGAEEGLDAGLTVISDLRSGGSGSV
jgi:hypothetical protein